jgi:threonine aldolase
MTTEKISFRNDYSEGAHPFLLAALQQGALTQEAGYGEDSYSQRAAQVLLDACALSNGEVYFVAGGTLANLVVVAALLKPYESVVAPETGHICVHEAGAIEATGHKVHSLPQQHGKITAAQVEEVIASHDDDHMVHPRLVFLSQPTEFGTLYSRAEIEAISEVCRAHGLWLYVDGARLAAALASRFNDLSLPELARLVDAFYLGGTKNGALLGEAVVFTRPSRDLKFRRHLKQRGALLAKGRLIGAQFEALLRDDLYLTLARHADKAAQELVRGLTSAGCLFAAPPMTNQIFPVLPTALVERLEQRFEFYRWGQRPDYTTVIRLVTSWATTDEAVADFIAEVQR